MAKNKACLRLKFTPLFNKNIGDSNCCLEIVPEISDVENLDKILWENNKHRRLVYKIPIVYKLVVKKNHNEAECLTSNDPAKVKVYHSCIDIVSFTSDSGISFAAGDVKYSSDIFITEKSKQNQSTSEKCELKDYHSTTNIIDKDSEQPCQEENAETWNPECNSALVDIAKVTNNLLIPSKSEDESLDIRSNIKKLSISPICSISTNGEHDDTMSTSLRDNKINSIPEVMRLYSPLQTLINNYFNDKSMVHRHNAKKHLQRVPTTTSKTKKNAKTIATIEYFKCYMEQQMLPVKLLFEEIKNKYVAITTNKKERVIRNSIENDRIINPRSCLKKRSNRVVYSIVFEE